jgi:hypothetical protein
MPDPTIRQSGRPDGLLTNVALSYATQMADNFVADQVFPVVPVDFAAAKYKTFPRSYFMRDEVGPRPLGGYPRQVGYKMSEDSYSAEEDALEAVLDDRERGNYQGPVSMSPEAGKVKLLQSQHLIHRDRIWAATYFKTGVWGTDLTGVASGTPGSTEFLQWDNDDSDPISLIPERSDMVGDKVGGMWRPKTLVLGTRAYRKLVNHPLVLGRMGVNNTRLANRSTLAELLEVDKVLVPQGVVNTGPEKETIAATEAAAVYSRIVGPNDALLVYSAPAPASDAPSGGYIFAWRGLHGAQAFNPTAAVIRGRDDRAASDWFQVKVAYDMKVVAPELGVFFSGAVAAA